MAADVSFDTTMIDALEQNLLTMPIVDQLQFHIGSGGGHSTKRTLIFEGGSAAIAKYAVPGEATQLQQVNNEMTAWLLLKLLGWCDLMPTTVLRDIVVGGVTCTAAVQTLLPEALLIPAAPADSLNPEQTLRAAAFDFLMLNTDRGGQNWTGVRRDLATPALKLFDHGNALTYGESIGSAFVAHHAGQEIPEPVLAALRSLTNDRLTAALAPFQTPEIIAGICGRRDDLLKGTMLATTTVAA
jgi:hypothetical protein